jgi:hypothetical protein
MTELVQKQDCIGEINFAVWAYEAKKNYVRRKISIK